MKQPRNLMQKQREPRRKRPNKKDRADVLPKQPTADAEPYVKGRCKDTNKSVNDKEKKAQKHVGAGRENKSPHGDAL